MDMASFAILCIFTFIFISTGKTQDFVRLQCVPESVGRGGQPSLLECVVTSTRDGVVIHVVHWQKEGARTPLLLFNEGITQLQPGYMLAEPSWNNRNKNVSLLIPNSAVEHEGLYTCMVLTDRGDADCSISLKVTDVPKLPSVSMSPPGDVMEGSSVTLSCSSDANPAANYTWYKENQTRLSEDPQLVLSSILSSDSGQYYCVAENLLGTTTSGHISVDVKYAPKLPSVSMTPPGDVMEGSSVNLSCSSDANPAANYTWYKENQDSPIASGQTFTITDIRAEDSGIYYCEAQNTRGRRINTFHLTVGAGNSTILSDIIRSILVVVTLIPLFLVILWMRKKKTVSSTPEPCEPVEMESDSCHDYQNVSDSAEQPVDLV